MTPPNHSSADHPTRVIGLCGPAGSGKDTVAGLLQRHCGAHVLAFADALRAEIADGYDIEQALLTERATKETPMPELALSRCTKLAFVGRMVMLTAKHYGIDLDAPRSPRTIMQWWGTEYRRATQPGYWTTLVANRVAWLRKAYAARLIVITDVRFEDEAALVRSLGGQLWQITRPGAAVADGAHVSEVTGAEFAPDTVIDNAGDLRHLQQLVLATWAAHEWGTPGVRVEVPA